MKILIDTREQRAWTFRGHETETATLSAGDYSLRGFEEVVGIERKELSDLIGCVTSGRERFKNELRRLRGYRCKAVIVEGVLHQIMAHDYRSRVEPESVIGSLASWQIKYSISFVFAGDRTGAERYCLAIFRTFINQIKEHSKAINLNEQEESKR